MINRTSINRHPINVPTPVEPTHTPQAPSPARRQPRAVYLTVRPTQPLAGAKRAR